MAKKAGQVVINLSAGTAQFLADMDKANAGLRKFGVQGAEANKHMVSSMQASSAAIRELEGNFNNNIRAVERFLATTLGLGPALQAAFPMVGAIAFGALVVEMGEKFKKYVEDVRYGAEIMRAAYADLNAPLRLTNDELKVANDRLENDIAKLEGRRQNTLKLALDEAKVAADKLAASLEKDMDAVVKLFREKTIFGTSDIEENLGGVSGFGGFRAQVAKAFQEEQQKLSKATTKEQKDAIFQQSNQQILALYDGQIKAVKAAAQKSRDSLASMAGEGLLLPGQSSTTSPRIEKLDALARNLEAEREKVQLTSQNSTLTDRKEELIAGRNNANLDRPFRDKMRELQAQAEEAGLRSKAVGLSEYEARSLDSYANAVKVIQEVNKALDIHKQKLTAEQEGEIISAVATVDHIKGETAFAGKIHSTVETIDERIKAQQLLTAAIGQGYEATKRAYVDSQMLEVRKAYPDRPESDFDGIRAKKAAEFEAQHEAQVKASVQALELQIEMERQLARVQSQGEEAVRRVALAYKLRELYARDASQAELQRAMDEYVASSKNSGAKRLSDLDQEIAGVQRLTAAVLGGAEAQRRAQEANQIAAIRRRGGPGVDAEIEKQKQLNAVEHQRAILQEAVRTGIQYQDQLESLDQQIAALKAEQDAGRGNLAVAISLRNLENERLKTLANQLLAMGGYRNAMRAFFLEMQQQSDRVARAIHDAMDQAFNGVADNFARLLTGQKSSFGKLFQSIGEGLISAVIKQGIQAGIKAIGNTSIGRKLGIGKTAPTGAQTDPIWTKRDGPLGTEADPIWVTMASPGALMGTQLGTAASVLGSLASGIGGGFSGFAGWGGGSPSLSGMRASGGDVDPSGAYLVGENGPEILAGVSGRVFSNPQSSKMLQGAGGHVYNLAIDARGADEAAIYRRVYSAVVAAHKSAIGGSVVVNMERMKRTPQ